MSALATIDKPVQLTLRLLTGGRRGRSPRRPYWDEVDLADLGAGSLRARRRDVRVRLDLGQPEAGVWVGFHDAVLPRSGSSGATRRQPTRRDALASAAHGLARHCRRVVGTSHQQPRDEVRAAREVLQWLETLDLL